MRIAFTGCSGTGKTTLARYISEKYKLPYEEYEGGLSTARYVANQMIGEPNPYAVLATGRYAEFQEKVQAAKREWEWCNEKGFVTDRTHIDSLAYGCMHDADGVGSNEDYRNKTIRYTNDYDIIFYLSPRHGLYLSDPVRKQSVAYHYNHDTFIRGFLDAYVYLPDVVQLFTSDLAAKKEQIDAAFNRVRRVRNH